MGCSSPENFDLYKDATLYSTENTIRDMDLIRQSYGISQWSVLSASVMELWLLQCMPLNSPMLFDLLF